MLLSSDIAELTDPTRESHERSTLAAEMLAAVGRHLVRGSGETQNSANRLQDAMVYSMSLAGKRARGLLLLLVTDSFGKPWQDVLDCAAAIELVHTASLIIDDLPAMDDAHTRRGNPTNHRAFGEPTAVLAAIALLNDAYSRIAGSCALSFEQRNSAIIALSAAVGPDGMTGGQQRDLFPSGQDLTDVELTHAMKTGALFAAAAEIGCIAAGGEDCFQRKMHDFGMLLGKAFQEFDDLIDRHGAVADAGKDIQKDTDKITFVRLLGRDEAESRALGQVQTALECLKSLPVKDAELRGYALDLTRAMRAKFIAETPTIVAPR
ncbi:MAG: polyprenyl synthetase family protein [Hyphomicrobiaceae bacterium]